MSEEYLPKEVQQRLVEEIVTRGVVKLIPEIKSSLMNAISKHESWHFCDGGKTIKLTYTINMPWDEGTMELLRKAASGVHVTAAELRNIIDES